MKCLGIICTLSLVLFSCGKEEPFVPEDPVIIIENQDIPLISRVLIGGELHQEYIYNEANLPEVDRSTYSYVKHIYNHKNQLVTSKHYWSDFIWSALSSKAPDPEDEMDLLEWPDPFNSTLSLSHYFDYNSDGQVFSKTYFRHFDKSFDVFEFHYEDGRICSSTGFFKGEECTFFEYQYDDRGNLIKSSRYIFSIDGITIPTNTIEYEFDTMKNPFLAFSRLNNPGVNTNRNNILKATYTNFFVMGDDEADVRIEEYTYEYNELGYPVRVNEVTEYEYK